MQASVITGAVKPDSWDELARLYQEIVIPMVGGQSGIKAAFLLGMPESNEAMSVAIYETMDEAIASGAPEGALSQAMAQLGHTLAGMTVRSICEVLSHR